MIAILFFYFLMASLFVFGKKACLFFSPLQLTAIRLFSIGALFFAYSVIRKKIRWKSIPADSLLFLGMSVSAITSDLFRFVSLTVLPASHSALVATTSPLIAAITSYLVFKERITLQKAVALLVGIVGILPLILHNLSLLPASSSDIMLTGYGCALLATIGFIAVGVFIKKLGEKGYPLLTTLGIGLLAAGTTCGIIGMMYYEHFFTAYLIHSNQLPIVVIPSIVGYPLYAYLVCAYPLTLVAFAQLSSPMWAALISWFHGNNDLSLPFGISFFVLTVAFCMFYCRPLIPRKRAIT